MLFFLKLNIKRLPSVAMLFIALLLITSCGGKKPNPFVSFYYWKSQYKLDSTERNALSENKVEQLYVRYFDIVFDEHLHKAIPQAPIQFSKQDVQTPIVPVVFIKNKVFEQMDSLALDTLAMQTIALINQINHSAGLKSRALQIDCDWTARTKENYFHYLRQLRQIIDEHEHKTTFAPMAMLTATIRLHQVKYPDQQGIPPVDRGVLMFYNMADINASDVNSIYDAQTSKKYIGSLASYPLRLDLALPIFAWGIQLRDAQVVGLLNKIDLKDIQESPEFSLRKENRYQAKSSFFKNGVYFKQGDEIKIELVDQLSLLHMAQDLNAHYPSQFQQIIFFDLDAVNLTRYDKSVFQKIVTIH
jgi:hypothetical protein